MTGLTFFFFWLSPESQHVKSVKGRRPTYCISMKKIKRGQHGRGGLVSKVSSTICTTRYLLRTVVHPHVIYLHDPSPPLSRIKSSKSLLRDSLL